MKQFHRNEQSNEQKKNMNVSCRQRIRFKHEGVDKFYFQAKFEFVHTLIQS